MRDQVVTSLLDAAANRAAKALGADGAVADYSRDVTGQLALVLPNAHRDDPDLAGHRATELRRRRRAA